MTTTFGTVAFHGTSNDGCYDAELGLATCALICSDCHLEVNSLEFANAGSDGIEALFHATRNDGTRCGLLLSVLNSANDVEERLGNKVTEVHICKRFISCKVFNK